MIARLTFALLSLHASATAAITWESILGRERKDCVQALQSRETFAFREIRWTSTPGVSISHRGDRFDVLVGEDVVVGVEGPAAEPPVVKLWWRGRMSTRTLHEFVERVTPPGVDAGAVFTKSFEDGPSVEVKRGGTKLYELYGKFAAFEAREWRRKVERRPMTVGFTSRAEGPLEGLSINAPTGAGGTGRVTLAVRPTLLTHPDFRMALHELIDATSADYLLWPNIAEALNRVTQELKP